MLDSTHFHELQVDLGLDALTSQNGKTFDNPRTDGYHGFHGLEFLAGRAAFIRAIRANPWLSVCEME